MFNIFKDIIKAIKVDMYRAFKGKMIYVVGGIATLSPILIHMALQLASQVEGAPLEQVELVKGMTMDKFMFETVRELFSGGFGIMLVLVIAVNLLADEYLSGMFKMRVMASNRLALAFSKAISLGVLVSVVILMNLLSATIIGAVFYGNPNIYNFIDVAINYMVTSQTLYVYGLLMMVMGLMFDKSSSAIAVGVGIYAFWMVAVQLTPMDWMGLVPFGYNVLALGSHLEFFSREALLSIVGYGGVGMLLLVKVLKHKELTV